MKTFVISQIVVFFKGSLGYFLNFFLILRNYIGNESIIYITFYFIYPPLIFLYIRSLKKRKNYSNVYGLLLLFFITVNLIIIRLENYNSIFYISINEIMEK